MNRLGGQKAQTPPRKTFFHSNPVMNRLNKVEYISTDEKSLAYGRIAFKTAWFLLTTVCGMLLYLLLSNTMFAADTNILNFNYKGFAASVPMTALIAVGGAAVLAIVTQLLAAFIPRTIPVTGTLYSLCQGFMIAFIIFSLIKGYEYLGLLALGVTVVVVLTMAFLYAKRIVKVNKKFVMIMMTLLFSMIGISLLTGIGYLIPLTRPFVASIMGNFGVSIAFTLISIVIACMFLISDFAVIENGVENGMPAKYEWMASFGLAFTILWIYIKVLDLIITLFGSSSRK